jgi:hypothetical protein
MLSQEGAVKRKKVRLWDRLRMVRYRNAKPAPAVSEAPPSEVSVTAFLAGGGPGDGSAVEAGGYCIDWIDTKGFVHHYEYDLSSLRENCLYADYQGVCGRVAVKE